MPYFYSDESKENEIYSLPDVWVTELTASEIAENYEDERYEFMKRPEFKLASMNNSVREKMIDAIIEENGITGGYCWCYCLPGCLPDSNWCGPFASVELAVADMRANIENYG